MANRSSSFRSGVPGKKVVGAKKPLATAKKPATAKSVPLKADGPTIAVTLFSKLKETDPMYTAAAIDALFARSRTEFDSKENKKKLALETIKTIATLGQNSSLYDTISVVKAIGNMLQSLYDSIGPEATS